MPVSIKIAGEAELWELLEGLTSGRIKEDEVTDIQLSGWNPEILYFPGETVGHSIRPSVAGALSEFHASIGRAYAFVAYGRPDARLLKNEDRAVLDLAFLVKDGSSGIDAIGEAL